MGRALSSLFGRRAQSGILILSQIVGSRNVALATAALVQAIVRTAKFSTIDQLVTLLKAVGNKLVEANPKG